MSSQPPLTPFSLIPAKNEPANFYHKFSNFSVPQLHTKLEQKIHLGEDNTLAQECIQQEALVVAMLVTHPLAKQEYISVRSLADEFFIMFPRHLGSGLYDQILSLCQQGNFSPKITQEANQMQTIIGLVSAGMGIATVPSSLQNLQRSGVVYRQVKETTPLVETTVVWQQENITPVLRQFLQVVKTVCS